MVVEISKTTATKILKYRSSKASAESEGNDEDNGGEEEKEAESEDGSE